MSEEVSSPALSESSLTYVEILLSGPEKDRMGILDKLPDLPDKNQVSAYLIKCLQDEKNGHTRSWIISGLAAINEPDAVAMITKHIDKKTEENPWTRYFSIVGLNNMQPDNLKMLLIKASKDSDPLVRAAALRLLIENKIENGYLDQLSDMLTGKDVDERWAALKALRRDVGRRQLERRFENFFIPKLVACLENDKEYYDVRYQAACALGDIAFETDQAIDALGNALKGPLSDWMRRACVDGLVQLKKPETKQFLLNALFDDDAEIRERAAFGLKSTLGASTAVDFIIDEILRLDEPAGAYFDALRHIDSKEAAEILTKNLSHPDPRTADRALRSLVKLGGEDAARILQSNRTKTLDTYTTLLKEADDKIMLQFTNLMDRAQQGFMLSMRMHGTIFIMGVVVLGVSLYVALAQGFETLERFIGVGSAVGSLGTLLLLFYKDPLKNIRDSVNSLMKANIVFLGYVRQINQIDATFKYMFFELSKFSSDQMKDTVEQIQEAVKKTLEQVKIHLDDESDE